MIFVYIALIVGASIVLIKAVNLFIESSSKIAHRVGISEYTVSFLIIAVATSLPEVVVGVTSAIEQNPILSYGNALGSNVALLSLVVALPIIFNTSISTRTILHSKDAYYAILFSLLPLALIVDGSLTKIDGSILLAGYVFYSITVLRRSEGLEKYLQQFEHTNIWKQGVIFAISLILLLASSEVIVKSATTLSVEAGLSLGFIGLSLTAVGTSLPEIAFAFGAISGRHHQEILGNIVGSVVANSTVVLGITSVISPIKINNTNVSISSMFFLVFTLLLFTRFIRTKEKLDKLEAVILLTVYIAFIGTEYYLQNGM